jgi:hypothetical protein
MLQATIELAIALYDFALTAVQSHVHVPLLYQLSYLSVAVVVVIVTGGG